MGWPVNADRAASVNTMCSLASTSYVFSWPVASSRTPGALRRLFQVTLVLSLGHDEHPGAGPGVQQADGRAQHGHRVAGTGRSPSTNPLTTAIRPLAARSDSAPRSAAAFIFLGVRCT